MGSSNEKAKELLYFLKVKSAIIVLFFLFLSWYNILSKQLFTCLSLLLSIELLLNAALDSLGDCSVYIKLLKIFLWKQLCVTGIWQTGDSYHVFESLKSSNVLNLLIKLKSTVSMWRQFTTTVTPPTPFVSGRLFKSLQVLFSSFPTVMQSWPVMEETENEECHFDETALWQLRASLICN